MAKGTVSIGRGGTFVEACTCTHKVQDELYGRGRRLHNVIAKAGDPIHGRCTICLNVKPMSRKENNA
jgi:hypothetical protein